MRKNPYNKNMRNQLPLFMQGPGTAAAVVANEKQKSIVERARRLPPVRNYQIQDGSFITVRPPLMGLGSRMIPNDIINIEMGKTAVTQGLFKKVMGWQKNKFRGNLQKPVVNVTWLDCIDFCNKLSKLLGLQPCYEMSKVTQSDEDPCHIASAEVVWNEDSNGFRLPTEYEWTSFAKAGTQNQWAGTDVEDELENYAWYVENSEYETHISGQLKANEWGLHDMCGNVREWCWDKGDTDGSWEMRSLCGGSFNYTASYCKIKHTDWEGADNWGNDIGFRICRTIK